MTRILRVDGPIVLDWGNGMRLQIQPIGSVGAAPVAQRPVEPRAAAGRRGRKPSPSTQALIARMQDDAAQGTPGDARSYIEFLRSQDSSKSEAAVGQIVRREMKRIFGSTPRSRKPRSEATPRARGRQPNPATVLIREKLAADKAGSGLRDASYYVKWIVDQPGVKLGLKGVRPIVYRELRATK